MNISTAWLREWIDPKVSDADLAEKLTMAGLEVNAISTVAPDFAGVVVGFVTSCEKHPDADKLNLCKVDIGAEKDLQIICGAKNIRAGLKVIVATIGAELPNELQIKKAKLRGVESFGMICSAAELGLIEDSSGISELDADAPIGQDIRQYLQLDDNIIELDITPNRGDCFSILGVAREVSALFAADLSLPSKPKFSAQGICAISASVSNPKACPKYLSRSISGIDNTVKTPQSIANKLLHSGQQLHSPVVDITNFVLLELGQPLHAFDSEKIKGDIEIRNAKSGEEIELLNETNAQLNENTLIVADQQKVLAIAGIMGGMEASTQENSTQILLESAFFEPVAIAGKARDYGLHTESSLRFERGVDFAITKTALDRATDLIVQICGGKASEISSCIDKSALPKLPSINISQQRIQKVLGFEMSNEWIEAKFKSLGFEVSKKTANSWSVIPPSFRFDIRIDADLIEELARLFGYDKLPVQKLSLDANIGTVSMGKTSTDKIMQSLVSRGYQEIISYSFIAQKYHDLLTPNANKITLLNPISSELSIMRSSLWAGLLQTLESNQRRGHCDARFFEIGLCFDGVEADKQKGKLAAIISGNRFEAQWSSATCAVDFFDAKADLESLLQLSLQDFSFEESEHPALQKGQTAAITAAGENVGWIGALSPSVAQQLSVPKCYLFEIDLEALLRCKIPQYQAFSQYQKAQRDICIILDQSIPVSALIAGIKALGQSDFVGVSLFDVYEGEGIEAGKKSLAFNLSYQSLEATLSDEEVNAKVDEVLALMQDKFCAIQR